MEINLTRLIFAKTDARGIGIQLRRRRSQSMNLKETLNGQTTEGVLGLDYHG